MRKRSDKPIAPNKRAFGAWRIIRFTINAFWIGGLIYILSGGYSSAVAWRQSRVTIAIPREGRLRRLADSLTREDLHQIDCLARNLYFEAGNQGLAGMWAVADVVKNRLKSGLYPGSICQIIDEGPTDQLGRLIPLKCQFTWRCDGLEHRIRDRESWRLAYSVAYNSYLYDAKMPDITGGAIRYHAIYVSPKWRGYRETVQIGLHKFFKPSG